MAPAMAICSGRSMSTGMNLCSGRTTFTGMPILDTTGRTHTGGWPSTCTLRCASIRRDSTPGDIRRGPGLSTITLACLLAALLMTSQRKLLASKWFPIGLALLVVLILPNLLWEMHHHWATLELLHNDQINGKNLRVGPLAFVLTQMQVFGPLMAPLWVGGILWLVFSRAARPFRFLGVTYLLYLPLMMILHAKDYYLAAIYPLYFRSEEH